MSDDRAAWCACPCESSTRAASGGVRSGFAAASAIVPTTVRKPIRSARPARLSSIVLTMASFGSLRSSRNWRKSGMKNPGLCATSGCCVQELRERRVRLQIGGIREQRRDPGAAPLEAKAGTAATPRTAAGESLRRCRRREPPGPHAAPRAAPGGAPARLRALDSPGRGFWAAAGAAVRPASKAAARAAAGTWFISPITGCERRG